MSKTFKPIDYLNETEVQLLEETKKRLKTAKSIDELKYYETVLHVLLETSRDRKLQE
ncbi:hypothetical protein [Siminovitchia acidinfaciens]|uniref:hypothetical protein n=1 Tax=Siminovitchia acidinfaciens TaxID=2321395 RepID=UPI0013E04A50|nr:hypothetical protein [Siminovitchia acidinfaciens]